MKGRHAHSNSLGSSSMGSNKSLNVQRQGYSQVQPFVFISLSSSLALAQFLFLSLQKLRLLTVLSTMFCVRFAAVCIPCCCIAQSQLLGLFKARFCTKRISLHAFRGQPTCFQRAACLQRAACISSLHAFRQQPKSAVTSSKSMNMLEWSPGNTTTESGV